MDEAVRKTFRRLFERAIAPRFLEAELGHLTS
jgi:hypothetical protein